MTGESKLPKIWREGAQSSSDFLFVLEKPASLQPPLPMHNRVRISVINWCNKLTLEYRQMFQYFI